MAKNSLHPSNPVDIALSRARALSWAVEKLGDPESALSVTIEDPHHPEEARAWLRDALGDALRDAFDEIEAAYDAPRSGAGYKPKDGAS